MRVRFDIASNFDYTNNCNDDDVKWLIHFYFLRWMGRVRVLEQKAVRKSGKKLKAGTDYATVYES